MKVLTSYDEMIIVERASIDEAYLDLTRLIDKKMQVVTESERLNTGLRWRVFLYHIYS